jgi:hypothetical protein
MSACHICVCLRSFQWDLDYHLYGLLVGIAMRFCVLIVVILDFFGGAWFGLLKSKNGLCISGLQKISIYLVQDCNNAHMYKSEFLSM